MRILAFDTATPATAVALADVPVGERHPPATTTTALSGLGDPIELRDDPPPGARPNHTRRLLELIEQALEHAGSGWEQVERLAVGVGPGTFTGLRIGIATAAALARSLQLPLLGVSTLAALALPARAADPDRDILAVLDARRGEAFVAAWRAGAAPVRDRPAVDPSVVVPAELERVAAMLGPGAMAVGDGAVKFAADLRRRGVLVPTEDSGLHRVSALAHCQLAAGLAPGEADAVQPLYLRLPDAEVARRR